MNSDHQSPFREQAISRSIFLQGVEPASLSTRPGFFSLLVFRGITYHTPFLQQSKRVAFQDLEDWQDAMQQYPKKKENFFCNMVAYGGSAIAQRSTGIAGRLWEAAEMWTTYLQEHPLPLSFKDAQSFMSDKETKSAMHSIGPLIRMLILGERFIVFLIYEPH